MITKSKITGQHDIDSDHKVAGCYSAAIQNSVKGQRKCIIF